MSETGHGVNTLLSIEPRGTLILERSGLIMRDPRGMGMKRIVRVGTNKEIPLSKIVLGRVTTFGATTLAKRDIPHSVEGKRRILTKVVIASGMVEVGMREPFSGDTLTQVLRLIRGTSRQGTPTRLFVHGFTHVCAPVIVTLTMLVILLPFNCSLVSPRFIFAFGS